MSEVGVSNAIEYGLAHGYTAEQAMDSVYGTGEFAGMGMGYMTFSYNLSGTQTDEEIIQDFLDYLSAYGNGIAWIEINQYRDYAGNATDADSAEYVQFILYH